MSRCLVEESCGGRTPASFEGGTAKTRKPYPYLSCRLFTVIFAVFFLADFFFATFRLAAGLGDAFFFVDLFFVTFFLFVAFFVLDFFFALVFFFANFLAGPGDEADWDVFLFGDFPRKATSQPSEYFSVEPTRKIDMMVFKPLQ